VPTLVVGQELLCGRPFRSTGIRSLSHLPSHAPCSTPRGERAATSCRDAPRPDHLRWARRARRVENAARPRARRERSHAQPRPFFTDGAARGEHPLFDTPEHRGSRAFPTAAFAALMACVGNAA